MKGVCPNSPLPQFRARARFCYSAVLSEMSWGVDPTYFQSDFGRIPGHFRKLRSQLFTENCVSGVMFAHLILLVMTADISNIGVL